MLSFLELEPVPRLCVRWWTLSGSGGKKYTQLMATDEERNSVGERKKKRTAGFDLAVVYLTCLKP